MEFHSKAGDPASIPDDLTVPQFILDTHHETRPERPKGVPWLVADKSGNEIGLNEIHKRTNGLAVRLRDEYHIIQNDVVPELTQAIKHSKSTLIITHSDGLEVVTAAARQVGIPAWRVLVLQDQDGHSRPLRPGFEEYKTVEALIQQGSLSGEMVPGRKLEKGESKRLIAFYSSSSASTQYLWRLHKMVKISHYAFVANIIITSAASIIGPSSPSDNTTHAQFLGILKVTMIDRHLRALLRSLKITTAEVYYQLIKLLPQAYICQGYGSTETSGAISMPPLEPKHSRLNSSGVLAPGVRARVVKPDGTLAGYDEEGELQIRTPAIATGYLNDETAWLRTGDLVKIDRNEEIIEMIKVRGFQVAPVELEGCILDHPLVADVCVIGVPHPYSGEVPLAFVTLSPEGRVIPEADLKASIRKHVAENKAPFKHLHYVEIIDSIPKTPSGKLLRRELRERGKNLAIAFNMHPTPKAVMSYRELKEIGIVTCGIQADLGI
ncbi:hypothetical protein CVT25_003343 [Psilocybe cyanescens]|uniref:AMP-dependent synthetase/ligase domain-containing protein n=1 Tax=Psilocybe cyanescens TaxID=93625 RepID=A0A409X076_PSICY|nr:hypothetical protein CVT25_003343 [Psilocybe cyanescens]